jgi:hypothetical protein
MCTNGVNASQFKGSVEQIDEAIALCRRWTHRAFHAAEDAYPRSAEKLKSVQALLDEARALLEETADAIDRDAAENPAVSVELV